MIIGYYNLWRDMIIKSLNIVAKVRNCFFLIYWNTKLQTLKVIDGKWCFNWKKNCLGDLFAFKEKV